MAYDSLGEQDRVGPLLNNIGRLHADLGEWADAEVALMEAGRRCKQSGDIDYEVLSHVNLARMWIAREDFERARESCDRACGLSRDVSGGRWTGEILKHYGTIYQSTDRLELALDSLAQARTVADGEGDTLLAAETARELAEVYRKQDRNEDTLKALNESLRLFSDFQAAHNLADIRERVTQLEHRFLDVVGKWGESIKSKDRYTQGHCERVAAYACALASAAGMGTERLRWFRMGALLHDVGKIIVPSSILNKPGRLSAEEWAIMKRHPRAGVLLLREIEFPWDIRPMVRHHHEHWDGGGYTDGLAGDDIPFSARILCLADVFDALTSSRSYRRGLTPGQALAVMREDCGRIFDPQLFELFEELHAPARRGWRKRSSVVRRDWPHHPATPPHSGIRCPWNRNTAPELLVQHQQSGLVLTGHTHLVASRRGTVLLLNLFGDKPLELLLRRPVARLPRELEQPMDHDGHRSLRFEHALEDGEWRSKVRRGGFDTSQFDLSSPPEHVVEQTHRVSELLLGLKPHPNGEPREIFSIEMRRHGEV